VIGIQLGPPERGNIGFHDSWKPRLECWSWKRLQRCVVRFFREGKPLVTVRAKRALCDQFGDGVAIWCAAKQP
jgi:hypothetical protein